MWLEWCGILALLLYAAAATHNLAGGAQALGDPPGRRGAPRGNVCDLRLQVVEGVPRPLDRSRHALPRFAASSTA